MEDQISLFPNYLDQDISACINKERERTRSSLSEDFISMIKSYYEGYGYISECFESISQRCKNIKSRLQAYIAHVQDSDSVNINIAAVNKELFQMISAAVRMAAIASRIDSDVSDYDFYYTRRDDEEIEEEVEQAKGRIEQALEENKN